MAAGERDAVGSARRAQRSPRASGSTALSAADLRFETTLDFPIARDGYVVVLVRGEQTMDTAFGRAGIPPIAFTNPIWLDVGGDGIAPDPGDPQPSPGTFEAVEAQRTGDASVDLRDASDAPDSGAAYDARHEDDADREDATAGAPEEADNAPEMVGDTDTRKA